LSRRSDGVARGHALDNKGGRRGHGDDEPGGDGVVRELGVARGAAGVGLEDDLLAVGVAATAAAAAPDAEAAAEEAEKEAEDKEGEVEGVAVPLVVAVAASVLHAGHELVLLVVHRLAASLGDFVLVLVQALVELFGLNVGALGGNVGGTLGGGGSHLLDGSLAWGRDLIPVVLHALLHLVVVKTGAETLVVGLASGEILRHERDGGGGVHILVTSDDGPLFAASDDRLPFVTSHERLVVIGLCDGHVHIDLDVEVLTVHFKVDLAVIFLRRRRGQECHQEGKYNFGLHGC
jgi:hypothetical protein